MSTHCPHTTSPVARRHRHFRTDHTVCTRTKSNHITLEAKTFEFSSTKLFPAGHGDKCCKDTMQGMVCQRRTATRAGRLVKLSFARPRLLCGWALSSSCPACPCLGRAPELCGWALWPGLVLLLSLSWPRRELCGWSLWPGLLDRSVAEQIAMSMPAQIVTNSLMKQFALGVKVGRTTKSIFD